jgi:hypothetical protein
MDKEQLIRDLFPPYVPSTKEVLDKLISDKIRPLEQSIADRNANHEAEMAADNAKLAELYAMADQLQVEITPQSESEPATDEVVTE